MTITMISVGTSTSSRVLIGIPLSVVKLREVIGGEDAEHQPLPVLGQRGHVLASGGVPPGHLAGADLGGLGGVERDLVLGRAAAVLGVEHGLGQGSQAGLGRCRRLVPDVHEDQHHQGQEGRPER